MIGGEIGERTLWWCEQCRASGIAQIDPRGSVYDAIDQLRVCHDTHDVAKARQHTFDTGTVRVERLPK